VLLADGGNGEDEDGEMEMAAKGYVKGSI